jgi:toxin ParE1/3/4
VLPIIWRQRATDKLAAIVEYIAERNPDAAALIKAQISPAVLPAAGHPYLFRRGRVPGTREIVAHRNYIVVYRVTASSIDMINVVHAARDYP